METQLTGLGLLTCTPEQSAKILSQGIYADAILWHYKFSDDWRTLHNYELRSNAPLKLPAWTFAELAAMIGPNYKKPDLWGPQRAKSATDPNTYPVFFPDKCLVFEVGAQAAAEGLLFLLEEKMLNPADCNQRYNAIFKRQYHGTENPNYQFKADQH
jgi:hypothetical protein